MMDIEKLYDLIYEKADKLLKQYNPCNIHKSNNKIICNNTYMCKTRGNNLCCGGCRYLSKNGCTTNCLGCKVGMCWAGYSIHYIFNEKSYDNLSHIEISEQFIKQMDKLRRIAVRYNINKYRRSKEEILDNMLSTV